MTPQAFHLSWSDGVCRLSHGTNLDEAEQDAIQATECTGRASCSVLNHNYTLVSRIVFRNDRYVTERV